MHRQADLVGPADEALVHDGQAGGGRRYLEGDVPGGRDRRVAAFLHRLPERGGGQRAGRGVDLGGYR